MACSGGWLAGCPGGRDREPRLLETGRSARVLYVEDQAPNRALLRAIISRCDRPAVRDATLLEAPDLATARSLLKSGPIDLVLLDVRLPDGSGLDLAREIRALDGHRPSVVIMSASVLPSERDAALASGASGFLAKPYLPADLVALIDEKIASHGPAENRPA
jgi:CheY-like chemotaxis protein